MQPVIKTMKVRCSVEHAFRVFTTRVDQWWPPNHRAVDGSTLQFEPTVGGAFVEEAPDGRLMELGRVLRWDPPHGIAYTWHRGSGDRPTRVEVVFAAVPEGTVVTVRHDVGESGLGAEWPERARGFARAWGHLHDAFVSFIDRNQESQP